MAANTDVTATKGGPTLLNATAVTALRVQNLGDQPVRLVATATTTPPTVFTGALQLEPYGAFAADYTLAQIFPGVASAAYVWAWPLNNDCVLSVSHG